MPTVPAVVLARVLGGGAAATAAGPPLGPAAVAAAAAAAAAKVTAAPAVKAIITAAPAAVASAKLASTTIVSNFTWPAKAPREGIVFDRWPMRLDVATEYQDWVLVGVSFIVLMLWCLPCLCGKMRNSYARSFTQYIYTRLNVFFWFVTYLNLFILMITIGILPDWTIDDYFTYLVLFISWVLIHLKKFITSAVILGGFVVVVKFQERIRMAAGLEHITIVHFNWKEMLGLSVKKRPVELFVWKVEDLQSSSGKIYKPNDLFVECHLGHNEPMRTRVHNNAGTSCVVKESFQLNINESEASTLMTLMVKDQALMVSTEVARLMLSTRELCGIEDQTGKRKVDFTYSEDSFVCLTLVPRGKIWIAIAPVEDLDEEKAPLIREDSLVQC